MRMPGVDGAELLTRVSEQYPDTVRLVLSGQSEHEKIFRAVGPAHQFMSKPCDPDVLISKIEKACGLNTHLQDEAIRNITSRLTSLPSLPDVYRDLVAELKSDEASIQRVADRISADLGMTAKVLQLVNSSFFGIPQKVGCVSQAVALLGLNIIRPLVLSVNVFSQYEEPNIKDFSLDRLFVHSLTVATKAKSIAEAMNAPEEIANDAFIAAMLQDIGQLVLATNETERFEQAIELAASGEMPLHEAESQIFNCSHAEIGAHLLGLWGLPNPIVEAVTFHHRPMAAHEKEFAPLTAIHIANTISLKTPELLDTEYLESIGLSTSYEEWLELSEPTPAGATEANRDR